MSEIEINIKKVTKVFYFRGKSYSFLQKRLQIITFSYENVIRMNHEFFVQKVIICNFFVSWD